MKQIMYLFLWECHRNKDWFKQIDEKIMMIFFWPLVSDTVVLVVIDEDRWRANYLEFENEFAGIS